MAWVERPKAGARLEGAARLHAVLQLNLILEIRWLLALHIRDNNSMRCYEIYPAGYTVYQTPDNTSV